MILETDYVRRNSWKRWWWDINANGTVLLRCLQLKHTWSLTTTSLLTRPHSTLQFQVHLHRLINGIHINILALNHPPYQTHEHILSKGNDPIDPQVVFFFRFLSFRCGRCNLITALRQSFSGSFLSLLEMLTFKGKDRYYWWRVMIDDGTWRWN